MFTSLLAGLSFAANSLATHQDVGQDGSFYLYSTALGEIISYGIFLGILLLIARGLPLKETFALNRPAASWPRTIGTIFGTLGLTYVLIIVAGVMLGHHADTDQGIPMFWDGSRAVQFSLNLILIAVVVPIVEELWDRGLGFSLLSRFGAKVALWGTALSFGLGHGFLGALPIFVIVGWMLGRLRMRTGSVFPGMVMHGLFNTIATILAVTLG